MIDIRLAIISSHSFKDFSLLSETLNKNKNKIESVAINTTKLGKKWAEKNNIPIKTYKSDQLMLDNCDALLAFWDCTSKETFICLSKAQDKNIPVKVIYF